MAPGDHKWAFITGAGRGLGRELALETAACGYNLVLNVGRKSDEYTKSDEYIRLAQKVRACGVEVEWLTSDFTDWDSVCRIACDHEISLLVNAVGEFSWAPPSAVDPKIMEKQFRANFFVPCWLMQHFLPSLQKKGGQIINIGTAGVGHVIADTFAPAYHISKMALLAWTKSLAKELAPMGVRVNMISPGKMENSVDVTDGGLSLPMQRTARFSELRALFRFLLSEESGYTTGQNIEVAGGFRLL